MSLAQFLNELILFLFIYGFLNIFSFINMRATVFYSVPFLILTIVLIEFHGNSLIFILIPGRWNHLPSPIILFPTMVDKLQKSVKKSPILHTSLCLCPLQYDFAAPPILRWSLGTYFGQQNRVEGTIRHIGFCILLSLSWNTATVICTAWHSLLDGERHGTLSVYFFNTQEANCQAGQ